ncbi:Protein of unknown function [Cotesia congregata]|uniref:Endonuclease/exonuclease/phosphatase domain-containing protein n=1 Tax=Cotesia congregata TaxID=51543 RepID=A0A8J2H0A9_COTCN|nr:Protein of unknown function [Cotesia congregata]
MARNDRDPTLSGQEHGGGVFIAIKRHIHADLIPIDDCNLELVFVKIKGTVSDIIVGCVYMPPLTSYEEYHSLLTTLTHVNEKFINAKLLLVGDFNLPSSVPRADCDKSVHDGLALLECTQINSLCNYNNNLLDLCFSNVEASIDKALPFVSEDKYHPAFTVYLEFQPNLTPLSPATYSFKKADYHNLNTFYHQVNWIELYETDTVENKVKWFYSKLEEGISRYVPVHRKFVSTYPCWFSYELINKIKLKKSAHSQYKKMKNQQNYTRFSILRRDCKILSAEYYRNYVDKIENMVQTDTNAFWKFIKDKKHNNTDIPSSMSWINQSASTGQDISNLLVDRRQVADLTFFYKVANGQIDAPEILSSFEFAPSTLSLRHNRLLKTTKTHKNYVFREPHNRIANLVNSLHTDINFYGGTYQAFITNTKNKILPYR